jgi:hypothetical protein
MAMARLRRTLHGAWPPPSRAERRFGARLLPHDRVDRPSPSVEDRPAIQAGAACEITAGIRPLTA